MKWFDGQSLRNKILIIVATASCLCATISVTGFLYFNKQELMSGIVNKERTIQTQLSAAKDFVASQGGLKGVIEKVKSRHKTADSVTDEEKVEILNQVPIVSAMKIGAKNQDIDHYKFRIFSDEPRRKENLGTAQELEVFRKFEKDPSLEEFVVNDDKVITLYRPVRLSESNGCLHCHGDPAHSPWSNGTDIVGHKMENWKDGKLHGVFAVSQNIEEVAKASTDGHMITPAGALIFAIVLGALISLLFAAWVARKPISELTKVSDTLAECRNQVMSASQQSASSATELSEASTEQAASLQETMASVEEISAMVNQNAESANKVKVAVDANQIASDEGAKSVEEMQKAIEEIRETNEQALGQMEASNREFAEIVKIISEIGEKTKVINDIVFQTKLLSFNASVEAARAGEHGKGFAVVAEEVGNLAQMSGNASKEISEMLTSSIKKVNEIVDQTTRRVEQLVEVGKDKISMGQSTAQRCRESLSKIEANAKSVASMISEITQASKEQAQGVQEINKAISQLDQVTQQNSAVAQQSSSQAEQLNSEAQMLSQAVSDLVASMKGKEGAYEQAGQKASYVRTDKKKTENKVTVLHTRTAAQKQLNSKNAKKVAGSDVPASNHPDFEEF